MTHKGSGGWRELLSGAGVRSVSVAAAGIFTGSAAEALLQGHALGGAIDSYNEWQVAALGRDINPDQLRKRILSPSWGENLTGSFRVDVVKPTYKALDDTQVAKFSGHLTVSHKVESEVV